MVSRFVAKRRDRPRVSALMTACAVIFSFTEVLSGRIVQFGGWCVSSPNSYNPRLVALQLRIIAGEMVRTEILASVVLSALVLPEFYARRSSSHLLESGAAPGMINSRGIAA